MTRLARITARPNPQDWPADAAMLLEEAVAALRAKGYGVGGRHGSVADRFLARAVIDPRSACWEWQGATTDKGYGLIGVGGGKRSLVHRLVFEATRGALLPRPFCIDHLCRNRRCCNPGHLEQVTLAKNNLRGVGTPAANARKVECKHGHPLSPENTLIVWRRGRAPARLCKTCHRENSRRYYARHREAVIERVTLRGR